MQVLPGYYTVPGSIYTRQLRTARAHKPSQMAMALSAAQLAEFEERGFVTVGTPPQHLLAWSHAHGCPSLMNSALLWAVCANAATTESAAAADCRCCCGTSRARAAN